MNYLFYNPLADAGKDQEKIPSLVEELKVSLGGEVEARSLLELVWDEFLKNVQPEDRIILLGGDGTLNYQINHLPVDEELPCDFYLYPSGTGNDFLNDVKASQDPETKLVKLNEFLRNLPVIEVKGKTYRFINGIGFGIDGECCKKADEMKEAGETNIDYSKITIHLLMKSFVPPLATVRVDNGEIKTFKKTYISAAMNGKYYGGGMMVAPEQERGSNLLSCVVIHGRGKLGTLLLFPSLFKGTHVKKKKAVYTVQGKLIEVTFDRPTALQIDGDVIPDVTSYRAYIR